MITADCPDCPHGRDDTPSEDVRKDGYCSIDDIYCWNSSCSSWIYNTKISCNNEASDKCLNGNECNCGRK